MTKTCGIRLTGRRVQMNNTIFYFITFLLACTGIYHIIGEIIWKVHKITHAEDIENMIDYMESVKKK